MPRMFHGGHAVRRGDQDLAIPALLHDSAEDQGGKARFEGVRNRFGDRVARVVEGCSDALADATKASERQTRGHNLAHLVTADDDVVRVSLADEVHNTRTILSDLRKLDVGETVWSCFGQPREKPLWCYRSLADKFRERCPGQFADELQKNHRGSREWGSVCGKPDSSRCKGDEDPIKLERLELSSTDDQCRSGCTDKSEPQEVTSIHCGLFGDANTDVGIGEPSLFHLTIGSTQVCPRDESTSFSAALRLELQAKSAETAASSRWLVRVPL